MLFGLKSRIANLYSKGIRITNPDERGERGTVQHPALPVLPDLQSGRNFPGSSGFVIRKEVAADLQSACVSSSNQTETQLKMADCKSL